MPAQNGIWCRSFTEVYIQDSNSLTCFVLSKLMLFDSTEFYLRIRVFCPNSINLCFKFLINWNYVMESGQIVREKCGFSIYLKNQRSENSSKRTMSENRYRNKIRVNQDNVLYFVFLTSLYFKEILEEW